MSILNDMKHTQRIQEELMDLAIKYSTDSSQYDENVLKKIITCSNATMKLRDELKKKFEEEVQGNATRT